MISIQAPLQMPSPYVLAFISCKRDPALLQAMLEDLLNRNLNAGMSVLEELFTSQALASDRRIALGVVSALRNYRFSSGYLPSRAYEITQDILSRELVSLEIAEEERVRFFREMLDFLSGSERVSELIYLIGLHSEIPRNQIPTLQAAIARFCLAHRVGAATTQAKVIEAVRLLTARVQHRSHIDSADRQLWRRQLRRLHVILRLASRRHDIIVLAETHLPTFVTALRWIRDRLLPRLKRAFTIFNAFEGVIGSVALFLALVGPDKLKGVAAWVAGIVIVIVAIQAAYAFLKPLPTSDERAADGP